MTFSNPTQIVKQVEKMESNRTEEKEQNLQYDVMHIKQL